MIRCSLRDTVAEYIENGNADKDDVDTYISSNLISSPLEEVYDCCKYITKHNGWSCGNLKPIYNKFIDKLSNNVLFYLNLAYEGDVNEWIVNPRVNCQVSFEDGFLLLNNYGEPIHIKNNYQTYSVSNSSFYNEDIQNALNLILANDTKAIVSVDDVNGNLVINGLTSPKLNKTVYTIVGQPGENNGTYSLTRYNEGDITLLYNMYNQICSPLGI